MDAKRCSKCGEDKPLESFVKEKRVRDGLGTRCSICRKETSRIYREKNKGLARKYYEKNKEKVAAYGKKRYEENKEQILSQNKKYRDKNKVKMNAVSKLWRENMTEDQRTEHLEKKKQWHADLSDDKKAEMAVNSHNRYIENKGEHKKKCQEWVENNREKSNSYKRSYADRHPSRVKESNRASAERNRGKTNDRARLNRAENREEMNAKTMARYYKNHEEQIVKHREWRENSTGHLYDGYIRALFKASGVKNPPQELIELKRVQLKIHRLINRGSKI
jgi:hypothetical protein